MHRLLVPAVLSILFACTGVARAAHGDLDPGWTTDAEYPGYGFYTSVFGVEMTNSVEAVLPAANGRVYLVGNMQSGADSYRMSVYRLLHDGLPDHSFGNGGLRTYVTPCANARVSDAALDPDTQRLWLAIRNCGDFLVYRLSANGDLDTSLLDTGVLQVPFDLGGDDSDYATKIKLQDDGGVLVAGSAATGTVPSRILALARFDADGQPVAGFGDAGRTTLPMSTMVAEVNSLHQMEDGRIVATGFRLGNGNSHVEYVARLQPGGQADVGFGTDGPGYSLYDPGAEPHVGSGRSGASVLLHDGSILRTGSRSGDFYIGRWLADGQRDLTLGPIGLRTFALDFEGTPLDRGIELLRLADGSVLLVGESYDNSANHVISLLRLRPDLTPDPAFGDGGKRRYLPEIASDGVHDARVRAVATTPERILVGINVATGPGQASIQSVLGLVGDRLFADSFE